MLPHQDILACQENIIPKLHVAARSVDYRQLTLTLRKPVSYAVQLVNHLGEIIETGRDFKDEIFIDLLSRWDVQTMISTNPIKTIDQFFDEAKDRAAKVLFDLSLTHSAIEVSWSSSGYDSDIVIWIDESSDNQTNLDADFIDIVLEIIDRKRYYWIQILNGMTPSGGF